MKKLSLLLVLLAFLGIQSTMAQRTITGTVISAEDGGALPGVSILIKGTTTGVVTNVEGKYSINVPTGEVTLLFQFIGMANGNILIWTKYQAWYGKQSKITNRKASANW